MSRRSPTRPVSHQTALVAAGRHAAPGEGTSVMALASMLAGERFTDRPRSVCPVIAGILRAYNDAVDDERRQDLYGCGADAVEHPRVAGHPAGRLVRALRA